MSCFETKCRFNTYFALLYIGGAVTKSDDDDDDNVSRGKLLAHDQS